MRYLTILRAFPPYGWYIRLRCETRAHGWSGAGPRQGWSRRYYGQHGTGTREGDHHTVGSDVLHMEGSCRQCNRHTWCAEHYCTANVWNVELRKVCQSAFWMCAQATSTSQLKLRELFVFWTVLSWYYVAWVGSRARCAVLHNQCYLTHGRLMRLLDTCSVHNRRSPDASVLRSPDQLHQ